MPDLPSRADHERELTAIVLLLLQEQAERVRANPANADWSGFEMRARQRLAPVLAAVYRESALQLLLQHGGSEAGIDSQAQQWAASYSATLAREISQNSFQAVAQAIKHARDAAALGHDFHAELAATLAIVFGGTRADMIGVSEVTRSISSGESAAAARLRALGVELVAYWEIEDLSACPVCKPLNGLRQEAWEDKFPGGPPAHPRCRCRKTYRLAREAA